jgi:hypothetical protein
MTSRLVAGQYTRKGRERKGDNRRVKRQADRGVGERWRDREKLGGKRKGEDKAETKQGQRWKMRSSA